MTYETHRYVSDREEERVSAKFAGIKKRDRRRFIVGKILSYALYLALALFVILGVFVWAGAASFMVGLT